MPQPQKRKISPQEEARLLYKLAGAYLLGAALSVALSFLPLLRGDGRDMGLAAFFGILGVAHLVGARYATRRGR